VAAIELKPGIYWVGLNDRTTDLFEGLWHISERGISYNSYLVVSEKNALIDLAGSSKGEEFLDRLSEIIDPSLLDYVVINHMEPDHTGVLRMLRRVAPDAVLIGSAKALPMLRDFYDVGDGVRAVVDGETLDLGRHRLRFLSTPFVHWPETMMTYEETHRVLFSCDAFGGYGALEGSIFDDQAIDLPSYEREALRYFANVVAAVARPTRTAIEKLKGLDIAMIAPSHGLVWRREPQHILSLYSAWTEPATGNSETGITLLYGSMYGNTEKMMNAVAQGVSETGVPLRVFDIGRAPMSYVLPWLWLWRGVLVGAPTYETRLFPPMAAVLDMAGRKRIPGKTTAYFGSYGWSGGGEKEYQRLVEALNWDVVDTLRFQGGPTTDDLKAGKAFGARFGERIKRA
jgi:anaerobic nitric oxide reductase flavorubredoxin